MPPAKPRDFGIVGRPLGAVVPAAVVVRPVAVVLLVRLVVLLVVAYEVAQCESVMGGDEVDAGPGRRPRRPWISADPENREAKFGRWPSSPFQNLRTVSRYWSFHSAQPGGKLPTWYPSLPVSQGSAINLTADSAGSCAIASRKPACSVYSPLTRAKVVAR